MSLFGKVSRSLSVTLSLATVFTLAGVNLAPSLTSTASAQQTSGRQGAKADEFGGTGSGTLVAMSTAGKRVGECPLKHTDVKASVSGYVARVSVKQTFQNPFKDKIEAVYTFPLPENSAVDEMTMKVGNRVIKGSIKKREEARVIYEEARSRGHVASLLDQERTNVFTQSVANIEPGEIVEIEIKYVDVLLYEKGQFTFAFPTVVGPRFNPGNAVGYSGTGRSPDTDVVGDGSRITPPLARKGERAGHDISISMEIDAGVPIQSIASKLHEINLEHRNNSRNASLALLSKSTIPNKDFVVSWNVAQEKVTSGYLTHNDGKSGYFTLMLMPPKRVTPETVAPKEMVFLIDCSGSQSGAPLEKAKETLSYIVDHMNPNDTFQIVSFNSTCTQFSPRPERASAEMRDRARKYIDSLSARGGTWVAPAVEKVCSMAAPENRLRVVTFMTDGLVGNEFEIFGMIKKFRGTSRWFTFGTGNSVNRAFIDGVAREGGGEADYVLLSSSASEVGKKFYDKISSPVLTDVKVEFNGLTVKEVYPHENSDVWAERPLYIKGRYLKPGAGTITLTGMSCGKPYRQDLKVNFPEKQSENSVLKPIWARAKVDRLMSEDWLGAQSGSVNKELKDEIVQTALDYHIMTQYTSFVAVEEKSVTKGGDARTVAVPVELPDGMSRDAIESLPHAGLMPTAMGGGGGGGSGGVAWSTAPNMMMARQSNAPYGGYSASLPSPASSLSGKLLRSVAPRPRMAERHSVASAPPSASLDSGSAGAGHGALGGESNGPVRVLEEKPSGVNKPKSLGKQPQQKDQEDDKAVRETLAKKEDSEKFSKLDKALRTLASTFKSGVAVVSLPGVRIENGKVLVKITLSDVSESLLAKLKALGFELDRREGKTISGKLPVGKLTSVAGFTNVLRIEPRL